MMKRYKDWRRSRLQTRVDQINALLGQASLSSERKVKLFWQRNRLYTKLKEMSA